MLCLLAFALAARASCDCSVLLFCRGVLLVFLSCLFRVFFCFFCRSTLQVHIVLFCPVRSVLRFCLCSHRLRQSTIFPAPPPAAHTRRHGSCTCRCLLQVVRRCAAPLGGALVVRARPGAPGRRVAYDGNTVRGHAAQPGRVQRARRAVAAGHRRRASGARAGALITCLRVLTTKGFEHKTPVRTCADHLPARSYNEGI